MQEPIFGQREAKSIEQQKKNDNCFGSYKFGAVLESPRQSDGEG